MQHCTCVHYTFFFLKRSLASTNFIKISTSCDAAPRHLPHDQSVTIDVGHDVGMKVVLTQTFVEDLWGHVAPGSCTSAQRDVDFITVTVTRQS